VAVLDVDSVVKSFTPGVRVLDDVTIHVGDGEIACLLGPSGCGKTTLLRIIAGLETPDSGRVLFDGEDVVDLPVHRRHFGFMFQDYALFPHMSAAANVAFGLRMAGWDKRRQQQRVDEMLELVDLAGYQRRTVDELSGGEQQRIALARTLAPSPRLLLLDEPLANLDRRLREELVDELRAIIRRVGVTTIFVTHDQAEAFALADHVVVMRAGRIEQDGTPQAVYGRPANAFVAGFLGFHNLLTGRVTPDGLTVDTAIGLLPLPASPAPETAAEPYAVLIRPDAGVIEPQTADALAGSVDGVVAAGSFRGGIYRMQFAPDAPGAPILQFDVPTSAGRPLPQVGDRLRLGIQRDGVLLVTGEKAGADDSRSSLSKPDSQ
jgi:ABC-type Fe3+/spermidine/putrescine transport system ATPase subunit